jgi:hypothetical protein
MSYEQCYLGLSKSERKHPIYRIISLARLYELFEQRANVLVRPHKWDDPFGNFMANVKAQLPSGEIVEFGQRHDFFGQCWSLRGSSDAMWRIYSSDTQSVRVKVRIWKLVEALAVNARGIVFAGKVQYLSSKALLGWARRILQRERTPTLRLLARTLLVKRLAFSHEQEVRLLYFDPGDIPSLFSYRIDPHYLIEELVIDPRLSRDSAAETIAKIRTATGFRGPITQSDLYAPPADLTWRLGNAYAALARSTKRLTYEGGLRRVASGKAVTPQVMLPNR